MKMRKGILLAALLLFTLTLLQTARARTLNFTYQGSLKNGGATANGNFDFEFALFDAASGGSQFGATVTLANVTVADGAFSVQLNFGDNFPGANHFLEIRVRQTGDGAFTTLSPRQPLNSAPYSIKSLDAETSFSAATATNAQQLGGVAANQCVLTGDGRLSDARNPLPGSADYIQNATVQQSASNFNISGTGAANIFEAATQYNLAGSRILSNAGTNNLFAGVSAGASNTDGLANAFFGTFAGGLNTFGGSNAFFGSSAGFSNIGGNSNAFFGTSAGSANINGNI
jgi:hypothetical protein